MTIIQTKLCDITFKCNGFSQVAAPGMIVTKIAGCVEEMRVQEHDFVKTGDILAIIEHHDLLAIIEQRRAALEKPRPISRKPEPTCGTKEERWIESSAS